MLLPLLSTSPKAQSELSCLCKLQTMIDDLYSVAVINSQWFSCLSETLLPRDEETKVMQVHPMRTQGMQLLPCTPSIGIFRTASDSGGVISIRAFNKRGCRNCL